MKSKVLFICILLVFVGAWLLLRFGPDAEGPRFVAVADDFQVPTYQRLFYDFSAERPFEGGTLWIGIIPSGTNRSRPFLYDIERKKVIGEFVNCWPVFANADRTKCLVNSYKSSLKMWLAQAVEKLSRGALTFAAAARREESFEVLDLKDNRSTPLLSVNHHQGTGSHCIPSPTSRYAYISATAESDTYVMDLEEKTAEKMECGGDPIGWWSDNGILVKTTHGDFIVYDVTQRDISFLLRAADVDAFLNEHNFTVDFDRKRLSGFRHWDGKESQFYFTDTHKRWEATNCFLVKIEKPSGRLKLLSRDFKFEWSDEFDPTGRYYLHTVRDFNKSPNVSELFLRDLASGETRTLVENCGEKAFPLANWYQGGVIYHRSNMLWQIELSGTSSTRLFPPP